MTKSEIIQEAFTHLSKSELEAIYNLRKKRHSMDIGVIVIKAIDLMSDEIAELEGDDDGADDEVDRRLNDQAA